MTPDRIQTNKRANVSAGSSSKRRKSLMSREEEMQLQKRKNFVTACEQISCAAYFDLRTRLLLVYFPSCMKSTVCKHHDKTAATNIKQLPTYAEESFKIEMKTNMWYEALEVCHLCITPTQYLSSDVLKDVVEIMLNSHEDENSEYTIEDILDKCQQVLAQSFSFHPPCFLKSLRKCYNTFLTSPLDPKDNTFTNRKSFESEKGIVKYCMNRLEYELSAESKDGPLIDKFENIPEGMKQSVQGLHWQKEKFEIFEVLERVDRIERLMAVLESVIELLVFDLGIWHSRYTNNLGCHIMRSHKPLMAFVLWSNNVLYTGAVNNNCRQILRIFANMVHLEYPRDHLKIITSWLNTMTQTFYACETNSNADYPNTGKYCTAFANEFYKIIADMPHESIIKIIELIEPVFMKHLIGVLHVKKLLSSQEDCIIKILTNFVAKSQWKSFRPSVTPIKLTKSLFHKSRRKHLRSILEKCKDNIPEEINNVQFAKIDDGLIKSSVQTTLTHVVHSLYVTLDAYLNTYNVQNMQETWEQLNEKLLTENPDCSQSAIPEHKSYSVSEQFIKKYRYTFQALKDLALTLRDLKSKDALPEILDIFGKIGLLDL